MHRWGDRGQHNITKYRERLDKVLASDSLTDEERLKALVKNQIIHSSRNGLKEHNDGVVDKRAKEVSNFLDMLRSAAVGDNEAKRSDAHGDWKVKQDTQECRVMYREGPKDSPYHTLLVEGYIDGPIDICLCISLESNLYKKWWPQSTIPPFKLISTECLQKVGIGEQISLVRMKVPWPLSAREALVHFFVFEYFQDDLVIVLMNSVSDLGSIDTSSHGFNGDILRDTEVVRVDLVGGFALQKVSSGRSYFRTIASMDMKVDFIPPAFINFISRQLIGSGFRLYQKEVASVSKGDEDFGKALKEPLYTQIRKALYSDNTVKEVLEPKELKSEVHVLPAEHEMGTLEAEGGAMNHKDIPNGHADFEPDTPVIIDKKVNGEIEEIEEEDIKHSGSFEEDNKETVTSSSNQGVDNHFNKRKEVTISSEVDQALGILDKVISMFREYGRNPENRFLPPSADGKLLTLKNNTKELKLEDNQVRSDGEDSAQRSSHIPKSSYGNGSRLVSSPSYARREASHDNVAAATVEALIRSPTVTHAIVLHSSINQTTEPAASEKTIDEGKTMHSEAKGVDGSSMTKIKPKRIRFCC